MKRVRGLTMIELLVGLAIGSMVIIGAVTVYNQSRVSYTINDTQARLQENARYALAIIEADVQLAGNYGFTNNASDIWWSGNMSPASDLEPADAGVGPAGMHTCGNNYPLNVLLAVEGTNGNWTLSPCTPAAAGGTFVANSDTLTVRRASSEAVTANAGYLQIYTNRLLKGQQLLFNSNAAPGPIDTTHDVRNLIFRTYYVAANSSSRAGIPTLWRKTLGTNNAGSAPEIRDEEILPGVEDFQIQFGIDHGDHNADGVLDQDTMTPIGVPDVLNGIAGRWVQPNSALIQPPSAGGIGAQVVAVRVWLRIRADGPETGYADTRAYQYAGMAAAWTPTAGSIQASTRRILVSRTFYVRNARVF